VPDLLQRARAWTTERLVSNAELKGADPPLMEVSRGDDAMTFTY